VTAPLTISQKEKKHNNGINNARTMMMGESVCVWLHFGDAAATK
jgi:hypothetical protein